MQRLFSNNCVPAFNTQPGSEQHWVDNSHIKMKISVTGSQRERKEYVRLRFIVHSGRVNMQQNQPWLSHQCSTANSKLVLLYLLKNIPLTVPFARNLYTVNLFLRKFPFISNKALCKYFSPLKFRVEIVAVSFFFSRQTLKNMLEIQCCVR